MNTSTRISIFAFLSMGSILGPCCLRAETEKQPATEVPCRTLSREVKMLLDNDPDSIKLGINTIHDVSSLSARHRALQDSLTRAASRPNASAAYTKSLEDKIATISPTLTRYQQAMRDRAKFIGADARTWSMANGNYKFTGALVYTTDEFCVLFNEGTGEIATLSRLKLTKADQDYIKFIESVHPSSLNQPVRSATLPTLAERRELASNDGGDSDAADVHGDAQPTVPAGASKLTQGQPGQAAMDAQGQYSLGMQHLKGRGVRQSDTEAAKWLRKSAEQGHARAQTLLGMLYTKGRGVKQDHTEAAKWYWKSAEQGEPEGQLMLGCSYELGWGVGKDEAEAAKWFHKSAEQGYAMAQYHLGEVYRDGLGVNKDDAEAIKWYKKAADQNHIDAQFQLGKMYNGGLGTDANTGFFQEPVGKRDYAEAAKWFRKAADQNHAEAQYQLGQKYILGQGVTGSYVEGAAWLRRAANQGHIDAQYRLGCIILGDDGVKNKYEAETWFLKAAEQGHVDAQFRLGSLYAIGKVIPKNTEEAIKWHRRAADQGHVYAQYGLGVIYHYSLNNVNEAVKWYRKAADQGHVDAQAQLRRWGLE